MGSKNNKAKRRLALSSAPAKRKRKQTGISGQTEAPQKPKPDKKLAAKPVGKGGVRRTVMSRPGFSSLKKKASVLEFQLATGKNPDTINGDLAAPHRAPYASLRDKILESKINDVETSVRHLAKGSLIYENAFKSVQADPQKDAYHKLASHYEKTRMTMERKLDELKNAPNDLKKQQSLVKAVNNLASNAPAYGPHNTTNNPVSNRKHLNLSIKIPGKSLVQDDPLTPRSRAAEDSLPGLVAATTGGQKRLVSSTGQTPVMPASLKLGATEDVNVDDKVVVRGSLLVKNGLLYRPRINTLTDWDQVT